MLGVAFGSRGRSAAMAHYEPSNRVINLTKSSGFGSFGHEFFHAYDHLIFSAMTRNQPKNDDGKRTALSNSFCRIE